MTFVMSTGFIPFFAILFLMNIISVANGQLAYPVKTTAKDYPTAKITTTKDDPITRTTSAKGYPTSTTTTTTTTKGYPTTTTTTTTEYTTSPTTAPPTCHGPNTTVANYSCQCQPVCGYGTLCPSSCSYRSPRTCVCAEQYVLDPHDLTRCMPASECKCKAPNEEFKTCVTCEPSCAYPNPSYCTPYCSAYNSRCVCKDGYLRTAYGVCVPKDSTECEMERTTTPPPTTTTTAYREPIHCYNGTNYISECAWYTEKNSEDYKKCVEYQKEREKKAFESIQCAPGVWECYDLRHNCHISDVTVHVKGCGSIYSTSSWGICNQLRYSQCGRYVADGNTYDCAACEGDQCNKGDIPRTTTTTYSTPPIYTTVTPKTTTTTGATKTTTKSYRG